MWIINRKHDKFAYRRRVCDCSSNPPVEENDDPWCRTGLCTLGTSREMCSRYRRACLFARRLYSRICIRSQHRSKQDIIILFYKWHNSAIKFVYSVTYQNNLNHDYVLDKSYIGRVSLIFDHLILTIVKHISFKLRIFIGDDIN